MKEIKYIRLVLPVRYGEEDMPNCMPFRENDIFSIMYDIKTGNIVYDNNDKKLIDIIDIKSIIKWNENEKRVDSILLNNDFIFKLNDLKVVDEGKYFLFDENGNILYSLVDDYVPDSYSVDGEYGDYINLHIDFKNEKILNLKENATFKEFIENDNN